MRQNGESVMANMTIQKITMQRLLSIYWLVVWRGLLGNIVFGFIAGAFIGSATGGFIAGLVVGLVWGITTLYMMLCKQYQDFRIVLVQQVKQDEPALWS
jgi:hypothetical protein